MADPKFDKYRIHNGLWWDVYVSERGGNNLGRIYFWLKRDGHILPDDQTRAEDRELKRLRKAFWQAIKQCFGAEHYNWAYLANEKKSHNRHCHYHLVPRYETGQAFQGVVFRDVNQEGHPEWKSEEMNPELAVAVGRAIKEAVVI